MGFIKKEAFMYIGTLLLNYDLFPNFLYLNIFILKKMHGIYNSKLPDLNNYK